MQSPFHSNRLPEPPAYSPCRFSLPRTEAAPRVPARLGATGFSLIEVVIAIGIVSFAFVAIFGIVPVGLVTARDSIDRTQVAQITQRMLADAQQTPFSNVASLLGRNLYFDGDGQEVSSGAPFVYSATYTPVAESVKGQNSDPSGVGLSAQKLRIVLIRIAKNKDVAQLGASQPFSQTPFVLADVKL